MYALVYAIVGYYQKTVDLALRIDDFDLAREYANKPQKQEAKKKLWMMITRKLVQLKIQRDTGDLKSMGMLFMDSDF